MFVLYHGILDGVNCKLQHQFAKLKSYVEAIRKQILRSVGWIIRMGRFGSISVMPYWHIHINIDISNPESVCLNPHKFFGYPS